MILPRRVVIISGPPCGGKTTLARHLAGTSDIVLDFDDIATRLGSPAHWLHPEPYRTQAETEMRTTIDQLPGTAPGTAYLIRSAAPGKARAILARTVHAEQCIVVRPDIDTCHERADRDARPAGTHDEIDRWFAAWSPWSGDSPPPDTTEPPATPSPALGIFGR